MRYIIDISPILDTGCLDQGEISVHNYYIKYYYITKLLQQQYGGPWARVWFQGSAEGRSPEGGGQRLVELKIIKS